MDQDLRALELTYRKDPSPENLAAWTRAKCRRGFHGVGGISLPEGPGATGWAWTCGYCGAPLTNTSPSTIAL